MVIKVLAYRLKILREEKGLLQKDLAVFLNISTSAYGYYEQGKRDPDTKSLQKLAEFYQVSTDFLLGRSDIRNPYIEDSSCKTTKAYHNLDKSGLPEEAIRQIDEYIQFVKSKYNPDGTLKKKEQDL